MDTFEYRVVAAGSFRGVDGEEAILHQLREAVEQRLNELGRQGFQVVTTVNKQLTDALGGTYSMPMIICARKQT